MKAQIDAASRKDWRRAEWLALAALVCGLLLGGVSAWFLGSVALAGLTASALTFNFHMPAAFVRLFAVGRTAARYGERLVGHRAALADQIRRRVNLFAGMAAAPAVRSAGWQLGDQARLADFLDDVEDVDYAPLRAGLPSLTIAFGLVALLGGSAIVAPLSLPPILFLLFASAFLGRRLTKTGAAAWERARSQRRGGAERFGAALASAVPLKAERAWAEECQEAMDALSLADTEALTVRRLQAAFDALASMSGPLAGVSVIGAAWLAGVGGQMLLSPAFVAFAWLTFGETLNGASRVLIANLRRDAAQSQIGGWPNGGEAPLAEAKAPREARELRVRRLQRISPSGAPIGSGLLDLSLRAGFPTVLVGASGAGKTSLLKQLAGWVGEDTFFAGDEALAPRDRRALTTLALHDAAVLDDSVRANLFAPDCDDEAMWRALEAVEMGQRIRQAGGLDGWIRQDALSLGEAQRLNLARAWLSSNPVILLDEPTEHLDAAQGERILRRLIPHLRDRVAVISAHRLPLGNLGQTVVLG